MLRSASFSCRFSVLSVLVSVRSAQFSSESFQFSASRDHRCTEFVKDNAMPCFSSRFCELSVLVSLVSVSYQFSFLLEFSVLW
jgi:hypothetical protein